MKHQDDENGKGQFSNLWVAIEASRRDLRPFREKRLAFLQASVGSNYGTTTALDSAGFMGQAPDERAVYVNVLDQMVSTYVQNLSVRVPAVMVSSHFPQFNAFAYTFQLALNFLIQFEVPLGEVLRRAAQQAMFQLGVVKIGLSRVKQGLFKENGKPFAEVVDFDNWVHDSVATRFEECQFFGDRYEVPVDVLLSQPEFKDDQNVLDRIKNSAGRWPFRREPEARDMSKDTNYRAEFIKTVRLWDIFLPQTQQLVTFIEDDPDPIRVIEWEGPVLGPYRLLSFGDVPGNVMPLSPVANLFDLHMGLNSLFRKLMSQAKRQKTNLLFHGSAEGDVDRVTKAPDGMSIRADHPDKLREVRWNGVDQQTFSFFLAADRKFSALAGNLDTLAGLSPQADTLGQENLMAASASKRVQGMQSAFLKFATDIIRDLGFYLWTDPSIEIPVVKEVPGFEGMGVPTTFSARKKQGDFYNYVISISPYALEPESPGQKLQLARSIVQDYAAMGQMMMQQGIALDFNSYLSMVSQYSNMPELQKFVTYKTPQEMPPGEPPNKPPFTQRTNVRRYQSTGVDREAEAMAQAPTGTNMSGNGGGSMLGGQ